MTRRTKRILVGSSGILIALGAMAFALVWYIMPAVLLTPRTYTDAQKWQITHEWTRSAALPVEAMEVRISTEGSDFTRQFRAHFRLPDDALARWIAASPGLSDAKVTLQEDGSKVYLIKPGGGAMFAEITINPDGSVDINTYWS